MASQIKKIEVTKRFSSDQPLPDMYRVLQQKINEIETVSGLQLMSLQILGERSGELLGIRRCKTIHMESWIGAVAVFHPKT